MADDFVESTLTEALQAARVEAARRRRVWELAEDEAVEKARLWWREAAGEVLQCQRRLTAHAKTVRSTK